MVNITGYFKKLYGLDAITRIAHSYRFSLDFRMSQTDNYVVVTVLNMIYSPSDMPQGLWRGYLFMGAAQERTHAC